VEEVIIATKKKTDKRYEVGTDCSLHHTLEEKEEEMKNNNKPTLIF
jgi:hypothetical protein